MKTPTEKFTILDGWYPEHATEHKNWSFDFFYVLLKFEISGRVGYCLSIEKRVGN